MFTDVTLARRLELSEAQLGVEYARTLVRLRPEAGVGIQPIAGGQAVFTGQDSPLSRAVGIGLSGPITHADLDLLETFWSDRGLTSRLDVCPLADASLPNLLGQRGGYWVSKFFNVHVQYLGEDTALDAAGLSSASRGIDVSVVGEPEAELWARTVARGFTGGDDAPQAMVDIGVTSFHSDSTTGFLARVDGEPVGGASLSMWEGLAALGGASTLPELRTRGVQTALLRARLAAASASGCDLATVRTLPGTPSERNVQRAGFHLAYTKLQMLRA